ncbi:MAG: ribosome maturation factor RimP [Clostridiales bacterium]|jgi:ribosome maturation factor RimP|nr:ribosome maturation factor RimP [Clostridiales bacterium]
MKKGGKNNVSAERAAALEGRVAIRTERLLSEIYGESGVFTHDIEFIAENGALYLRIYIGREGGVTINDCEFVSRAVEPLLDREDFIEPAYTLEVCSPGVPPRPFRQTLDKYLRTCTHR